uniref:IQ motif and ubiquitin domain containing n=1 Tax=Oryzias latipes TaxID=8090 RepID=A0A3P9K5U2_ORYLA
MLLNFIWKNRIHYLKKSVLMNSYEKGGLNFLDFTTLNNTFKINWIKSYLKNPLSIWNIFPHHMFAKVGGLHFLLLCHYNIDKIPVKLSAFHRQTLLSWFVMVKNEHSYKQKAFLGGYRHQLTGTEYHHAAVQTLPRKKPDRGITVFSRDSQTVRLKSHNQQCRVNTSTQMAGIGCYVSCMKDKLVTPGKYITADEWHDRKLRAVIFLQSLARRWLAQKAVDQLRNEQSRQLAWLEMQERRRESEKEDQQRDLYQRRMNPKRREDFNLLYKALESK